MRISIIKGTPNYNPVAVAAIGHITLNGEHIKTAVAFDYVEGWIEVYAEPSWEKTKRRYGKVEIQYSKGWDKQRMLNWGERK